MPSSSASRIQRWLGLALAPFGDGATHLATAAGHVALALLIVTGETIRWIDYRDTLISAPMMRATHALAGFVLLAALVMRVGHFVLVRRIRPGRHESSAAPAAFHPWWRPTAAGSLKAAWWLVVGALALSGLERYVQLRHGMGLLPGLPPTAWWALHRPLLPYLYAILLLNLAIRGRMAARRALSYLYTP